MDFNATIDLIIKDLNETCAIIDDLKKYPGIPVLQVELAKSKCKSAGEVIALLKTLKEVYPETREEPVISSFKKEIPEIKKEPAKPSKTIPVVSVKEEVIKTIDSTEGSDIMKNPVKESETSIVADKFNQLSASFNDQLGSLRGEEDVTDILKTKPINSLSEAIGVNDKFLFIREIFKGNKDSFSQAISRLEHSASLEDAKAVIMSYTGESNENEAVKELLDLVKRKLPSNE
jgi:hypothetical protein